MLTLLGCFFLVFVCEQRIATINCNTAIYDCKAFSNPVTLTLHTPTPKILRRGKETLFQASESVAALWAIPFQPTASAHNLTCGANGDTQTGEQAPASYQHMLAGSNKIPAKGIPHDTKEESYRFLSLGIRVTNNHSNALCSPARLESTRLWAPPIKGKIPRLLLAAIRQCNSKHSKRTPIGCSQHFLQQITGIPLNMPG